MTALAIVAHHVSGRRGNPVSLFFVLVSVTLLFALFDSGQLVMGFRYPETGEINPHYVAKHGIWLVYRWGIWGLAATLVCWWSCRRVVARPQEESPE